MKSKALDSSMRFCESNVREGSKLMWKPECSLLEARISEDGSSPVEPMTTGARCAGIAWRRRIAVPRLAFLGTGFIAIQYLLARWFNVIHSLSLSSTKSSANIKMVSTRGHPQEFSEPDSTPSRAVSRVSRKGKWAHTPSNLTIVWLFISLPLVAWDAGYVMLRPHSMPGGSLHWPLWAPYELYGKVDYIYGWKAYNEHNGFTAAQTFLNIIESLMYVYYLYILYAFGKPAKAQGRGAPKTSSIGFLGEQRFVDGQQGAVAVLVAFSAAVMTVSKTVLYCEYST